jgi:hypothetical protein
VDDEKTNGELLDELFVLLEEIRRLAAKERAAQEDGDLEGHHRAIVEGLQVFGRALQIQDIMLRRFGLEVPRS